MVMVGLLVCFLVFEIAVAPLPSVTKVAFSGGGIRATMGSVVAHAYLEANFDPYREVHGLSGGSWGIMVNELGIGQPKHIAAVCDSFVQSSSGLVGPTSETIAYDKSHWNTWYREILEFIPSLREDSALHGSSCARWLEDFGKNNAFRKKIGVHVAVSDVTTHKEYNDCWFTNGATKTFRCLYDHWTYVPGSNEHAERTSKLSKRFKNKKSEYKFYTPYEVTLQDQVTAIEAVTYSSAAWSTSECLDSIKIKALLPLTPLFKINDDHVEKFTDGGGYVNLPIISMIFEWMVHKNSVAATYYGFDFTAPPGTKKKHKKKPYSLVRIVAAINKRINELIMIPNLLDVTTINEDDCYATFTLRNRNKANKNKLTVRIFGLCGLKDDGVTYSRTWLLKYPTTDGAKPKRWTHDEMTEFVERYGKFLHHVFTTKILVGPDHEPLKGGHAWDNTYYNCPWTATPALQRGFLENHDTVLNVVNVTHHKKQKKKLNKHLQDVLNAF